MPKTIKPKKLANQLRVINRRFSVAQYKQTWTKQERYLFVECYHLIKQFFEGVSAKNVTTYTTDAIALSIDVSCLHDDFFDKTQVSRLSNICARLAEKHIAHIEVDEHGQTSFDFVSMFTRISYKPKTDRKLHIKIPKEIYNEMLPISSFCQLRLDLLAKFNSGNTIRLYEIFKSYAFRGSFSMTVDDLRKQLGFYDEGKYEEWRQFNSKVIKPTITAINQQDDIVVSYSKVRGDDTIHFTIVDSKTQDTPMPKKFTPLTLDDPIIDSLNLVQDKYVDTLLGHCVKQIAVSNPQELKLWIAHDLAYQSANKQDFNFVHACNAISKQIREGSYSQPYSFKYAEQTVSTPVQNTNQTHCATFDDEIYNAIKTLEQANDIETILSRYTTETLDIHRFGYLLS